MDNYTVFGSQEEIYHSLKNFEDQIKEEESKENVDDEKVNNLRYAQMIKGLYLQMYNMQR